jgi:hypothetical protein
MGRVVSRSDERLFMKFPLLPLVLVSLFALHAAAAAPVDWLIDPSPFKARVNVSSDGRQLELNNGLIRRVIRLQPNAATVALDNLVNGESLLRGVKPEAVVEIDGRRFDIGGLKGQPNYAFLRPEWVDQLRADPAAFRFVGYEIGQPRERFAWKRTRHHAPDVQWPPAGATLRLDFAWPLAEATDELPSGVAGGGVPAGRADQLPERGQGGRDLRLGRRPLLCGTGAAVVGFAGRVRDPARNRRGHELGPRTGPRVSGPRGGGESPTG